jgi:nicotinate-nucleotide pyrophosphorylase (carboxylating)
MNLNFLEVEQIVRRALNEDIGSGDITTALTVSPISLCTAHIIAKEAGIIAGIPVAAMCFQLVAESYSTGSINVLKRIRPTHGPVVQIEGPMQAGKPIRITAKHLGKPAVQVSGGPSPKRKPLEQQERPVIFRPEPADGSMVQQGDLIAEVNGPTAAILTAERTALNFLQRLSGIATRTARMTALIEGTGAAITDTRKTTPGLRMLEKYAVRMGGGQNHRFGLYDAVLIKDNHIKAAGGIKEAIQAAKVGASHMLKIEVEADTLAQVEQALEAGADIILLDNMNAGNLKKAVEMCRGRAVTEASGRVTEENIARIAQTGVDLISIGALTHSARALDLSLEIAG